MRAARVKMLLGVIFALALPSWAWAQGSPLPPAEAQYSDQNGAPLGSGSVKFCVVNTGCATLKTTYKDYTLQTPNTNPVQLDAAGRAFIFGSGTYEQQVYDLNGNLIFDGVTSAVNGSLLISAPGQSLLGNSGTQAQAPGAIAVAPPLVFGPNGLTISQSLVADNTNQLVDSTFNNTQRYTTGTNPLSYTLSASSTLASGFTFTIIANVPVTITTNASDTIQNVGTTLNLSAGQTVALVTNGAGLWFATINQQVATPIYYPGQVVMMRGASCPPGTTGENGAALSRTTYAALFAQLGTFWGAGDGSTTFNIPNAGGQFNRGWESGQTVDAGRVFGSTQADAFQEHTFDYLKSNNGNIGAGSGGVFANFGVNTDTVGPPIADTGGTPRTASETRPTNITEISCIATGLLQ